jgi:hypothetical protein
MYKNNNVRTIHNLPNDFIWKTYLKLNPDITILTKEFAEKHYLECGIREKRYYKEEKEKSDPNVYLTLPNDFDWKTYLLLNPDITIQTQEFAKYHYLEHGVREKRYYKDESLEFLHRYNSNNLNNSQIQEAKRVIQFKPTFTMNFLEHRGGWKTVLEKLIENDFYNETSSFDFFDMLETKFLWKTHFVCDNNWAGIIHCTPISPPYLNYNNIEYVFNNLNFIKSLEKCVFLITLSDYITQYIKYKLFELNIQIPVYTLTYPIDEKDIPLFNCNEYLNNTNKLIIQLGQHLRKMSSIYLLDLPNFKKIWLTGTKSFERCKDLLNAEIEYLNIDKEILQKNANDVTMIYTETYQEYDSYLSKNIVLIDLFDAAANTAIVECIIRNTPILVNKVGGVIDYLGPKYPLYFNELKEIPALVTDKKIKEAYDYLSNMNKDKFKMDTFLKDLFNIIDKHKDSFV